MFAHVVLMARSSAERRDQLGLRYRKGGRVYLAAEAMFLPGDVLDAPTLDGYRRRVQDAVTARFRLGPPLISPGAQYYYPLLEKKPG